MAIINCPECDKKISDKSKYCIGCGVPNDFFTPKNRQHANFSENDSKNQKTSTINFHNVLSQLVYIIIFTLIHCFFIINLLYIFIIKFI